MNPENGTGSGDGSVQKKYWFRPKRYGYGLTPISWEGWLLTLLLIGGILLYGKYIGMFEPELEQGNEKIIQFVLGVLVFSFLFVRATASRCDGELKWRWGLKK